jgi:putative heme transporter
MTENVRGPSPKGTASRAKKTVQAVASLAFLAAIFWFVLRQFADLSEVWTAIQTLTRLEVVALAAATIWNLITYWLVVVIATPGLTVVQAGILTQSTTAVANAIPAGGAVAVGLTYTIMSSWGFSKSRSTLSIIVTGIWNNFVKLGTPIFALAILALQGGQGGGRLVAAAIGLGGLVGAILLFALVLRSEDFARRTANRAEHWASSLLRLLKREPTKGWDLALIQWRARVIGLVRDRWLILTAATLVSHISLYGVLLLSLRVLGVSESDVGWAEVLAVFAFARLLTAIPLTPGGVGVVELALIAGLSSSGGEDAQVVAAVLMFRLLTYVLPILVGGCSYIVWQRKRSWRNSAPPSAEIGVR